MHHSGVTDFNAFTWDEFVEKAIDFYQNFSADKMKIIRDKLLDRANETHPYNIESYAKEFEMSLQNALAE
jgi:hypothetical protein